MLPSSFDPSSLVFLILGKDNSWIPIVILATFIFQKWDLITQAYNNISLFGKTQYTVSGTFYTNIQENNTYGSMSNSVWAIIRYVDNIVKSDSILLSAARDITLPHNDVFNSEDTIVIPGPKTVLKLTENINCHIILTSQTRDTTKHESSCSIDITTITLSLSTKKSFDDIMRFMNKIIKEHMTEVTAKNMKNRYIVKPVYSNGMKEYGLSDLQYGDQISFKTTKSFDNLFFEGKEELIKRLDTFINREKYKTLGLPETLGLLLHGAAGTGKTSCIKAIAKYLDMSLILVPMNQIKTKKRLEELFFSDNIIIPQEKRIYVFEEIDCNGWENIVKDRALIKDNEDNDTKNTESSVLIEKLTDSLNLHTKSKDKNLDDKLTLGGILEVIDGIIECPGRVIIMTTNHKEQLDSALLRPGRIDMDIELKKLCKNHIAQIYRKWFNKEMAEFHIDDITDYKYSQAEVSQLLFKYENDSKGFIREITA